MRSGSSADADRVGGGDLHQPVLDRRGTSRPACAGRAGSRAISRDGRDPGTPRRSASGCCASCSRSSATAACLASVGMGALHRSLARSRRAAVGAPARGPMLPCDGLAPRRRLTSTRRGVRPPREGGAIRSCLGVLAGVPGAAAPVRSGGSSPDRHATCGPRAQAVFGWYPSVLCQMTRLSAVIAGLVAGDSPAGGSGYATAAARIAGHVDPDARAHRAGDRQRPEVLCPWRPRAWPG